MDGDEENFNNYDAFWKLITLEDHYMSGTSKASAIRNPVLPLCHRGISNSIFARSDTTLVDSRNELPPQHAEDEDEFEDKQVIEHEAVARNGDERGLGMVPGYEDDYEEDLEEVPEMDLGGNPE